MVEIQGKFITLAGMLLADKPEVLATINEFIEEETGCTHLELDPNDYYDIEIWIKLLQHYRNSFDDHDQSLVDLGKRFYPTMKRTGDIDIINSKNPLDYLRDEINKSDEMIKGANGALQKKIIEENDNEVIMLAPSINTGSFLHIGVWLGLFEMLDIKTGGVEDLGNHKFRIYW